MSTEQQRKMLECAAKACGFECGVYEHSGANSDQWFYVWNEDKKTSRWWNPLSNPADTAEMCAKLDINTYWHINEVECSTSQNIVTSHSEQHNGTDAGKESAQRLAAMMVAAKIGDLK